MPARHLLTMDLLTADSPITETRDDPPTSTVKHAAASSARLSVRLFGDFRLRLGEADARPRGRKAAGMIAFLASPGIGGATRATLADLFWSDRGEEQARASLRQAIAELRGGPAGAAGALVVTRDAVRLAAGAVASDLDGIAAAAAARDAAALASALASVRGGFLRDMDGLSPAFDDWLAIERTRQEEWLIDTVLRAAGSMLDRADPADLRTALGALGQLDPLNEAVVRLRLRLDHRGGDIAALHRRYRLLEEDLGRALAVAPSRETQALFETLLSAAPTAAPPTAPSGAPPVVPPPATRMPPVVLVTPLEANDGADAGDLAAICTEDVRTLLARNGELRVLAVDAVEPARMQAVMANAVAAYRLSGTVRVRAGQTTVSVALGNIVSGFVTWSDRMRLAGPPLELADDIVARIVGAVGPAVERDVAAGLPHVAGEGTREAALLYVRGRRLVREARTLAEAQEGAALLEEVIRQDPRHVGARMRLSQLYNTDFCFLLAGHDVAAFRRRATRLIEEAAALEPNNIRVMLRLAWCHLRRREWALAGRLFRAGVAALPHDADALNECGFGFTLMDERAEAEALMQRAFRLNPFAPAEYHADHAVLLALAGDAAAAEEHFAICAERRLCYLAVRLGNLARLDADAGLLRDLRRRFVEQLRAIWQGAQPPVHADLVAWLDYTLCFRRAAHRRMVLDGIAAAWAWDEAQGLTGDQSAHDQPAASSAR